MSNVVIGWQDPGTVNGDFAESLTKLVAYSMAKGILAGLIRRQSGPIIEHSRNTLTRQFLASDHEWLLMIDADMTFEMDALEQLLAAADPTEAPIVGGLCFGFSPDDGPFPTMYRWDPISEGTRVVYDQTNAGVYPVDATGAAFLLVHRTVFEQNRRDEPMPWFRQSIIRDRLVGEDVTFCLELRQAAVPIYVHTGVKTGHVKQFTWNQENYETNRTEYAPAAT
jgi:GT2 family glycosyltransferase